MVQLGWPISLGSWKTMQLTSFQMVCVHFLYKQNWIILVRSSLVLITVLSINQNNTHTHTQNSQVHNLWCMETPKCCHFSVSKTFPHPEMPRNTKEKSSGHFCNFRNILGPFRNIENILETHFCSSTTLEMKQFRLYCQQSS